VNIWAYHMSVENYIRHEASLDKARELALLAYANLPDNEKICYDLGTIAKLKGELEQARFFAGRAVELNREWDLPLGLLCELEYMGDADPKMIICDPGKSRTLSAIAPQSRMLPVDSRQPYRDIDFFRSASADPVKTDIDPDDPGLIIYTSGTTGNPKGAVLTHRNLVHDAKNVISIWEITKADVLCHALPLFHVHGLCFALHTALLAGARVVLLDRFVPDTVLGALARKNDKSACTLFMAVPAMYAKLLDALGEKRAQNAQRFLVTLGVAASRLSTVSYGEERPLDSGTSEEVRAKNRRAHFVIET